MITAALALVLTQATASDFFPMETGMKWTYESTGDGGGIYTQEIGKPTDVNGQQIAPVLIVSGTGKVLQTTYYQVGSAAIQILGHDPKSLHAKPIPVFELDAKGAKWQFQGPSPYENDKESGMTMDGQSKLIGERTYLGEKRECLEVKTETKIGLTPATATTFKHTTIYAKGIGMVEMSENASYGRRNINRKVKILKFERGDPGA